MTSWDAVVLLQMGGPDTLDDVEPFLQRLFQDPDLIRLPPVMRPFQGRLANTISRKRAPKVQVRYEAARGSGHASPIRELTEQQARGLEARLGVPVLVCMRYSEPGADAAVERLRSLDARDVLLLPLYPHYSGSTTGSSVRDFCRAARRAGRDGDLHWIPEWGDHDAYVEAVARSCEEAPDSAHLVLSAHSLPEKYVKRGDPYADQVQDTVARLHKRLDGRFQSIQQGYQSAVGPARWLGPETEEHIERLARDGVQDVALAPLGFVTDHIETLYDLDQKYRTQAEGHGMTVHRVPSLNDRPDFLDALATICQGPARPLEVSDWTR